MATSNPFSKARDQKQADADKAAAEKAAAGKGAAERTHAPTHEQAAATPTGAHQPAGSAALHHAVDDHLAQQSADQLGTKTNQTGAHKVEPDTTPAPQHGPNNNNAASAGHAQTRR